MRFIGLEQGSAEWLKWRSSRITATDSSIITGHNPYRDQKTLWKEKFGMLPAQKDNAAMARGRELEPVARALFIEKMKIEVNPAVVEHDEMWWLGASLDGIDASGKYLIEIKCPKLQTHLAASNFDIPIYYQIQMQHQLACTGAELCFYVSYCPNLTDDLCLVINEILPRPKFIDRMIYWENEFFKNNMCQWKEPENLCNHCPW